MSNSNVYANTRKGTHTYNNEGFSMNISIRTIFSLFIGLLVISSLNSMENPGIEPINIEKAQTKGDFEQWLKQEEVKLWEKLHKVYGIDQNQCQELKRAHKAEYDALVQEMVQNDRIEVELSQSHKNLVAAVLKDFGCENDSLQIVPFAKRAPAGSTDTVLFINQDCIPAPMPLEVKKYVVALAVAMALYGDHSTDFELAKLRQLKSMQESQKVSFEQPFGPAVVCELNFTPEFEELSQIMAEYERLKVVRADIRTMLLGDEYRKGQNLYVQRLMNQSNADDSDRARFIIGQLMKKALS